MKYITIQSDTDMSNPFIEGFVKVGRDMESVADELGLKISGLLTSYGIDCTLEGDFLFFKNFKMNVKRKIENVTTNVIPTSSPYSNIIELESDITIEDRNTKIAVQRNVFFGKIRNRLSGLKANLKGSKLLLYSNKKLENKINPSDLDSLGELAWLNYKQGDLKLRALTIPDDKSEILNWLDSIESLIKKCR